jgi:hypothetical protein
LAQSGFVQQLPGESLTARTYKEGIRKLHDREAAHISQIDDVREDAQRRQSPRKAIDQAQENLRANDKVYQPGKELLRNDGVLLYELRKVIEARSYHHTLLACGTTPLPRSQDPS